MIVIVRKNIFLILSIMVDKEEPTLLAIMIKELLSFNYEKT